MPFGIDFGNGDADRQYFQYDDQAEHYLAEKQALDALGQPRYRRHGWLAENDFQTHAHAVICAWMNATIEREHPRLPAGPPLASPRSPYDAIARRIQEDIAVVQRMPVDPHAADARTDADRLIMAHVCFPSDWPSDQVLGKSFREIHGPVPNFADRPAAAASMVDAMIERGPYVRFVWSLCPDDDLDHHPTRSRRAGWPLDVRIATDTQDGRATTINEPDVDATSELDATPCASRDTDRAWLRVERQITVPFPDVFASLFLIRTYLYPLDSLTHEQRQCLIEALDEMPVAARRYKNLEAPRAHIQRLLASA